MLTLRFRSLLLVSAMSFTILAQTPPKESTGSISGVVTLNGEPMRGVSVTLQMQNAGGPTLNAPPRAKTDANGRFRITGVSAGQYIVGALAPGFVSEGNQSFGLKGKTLTVAEGETVENLELTLKRGGVITGRITDSNGEPVVETNVRLTPVIEQNPGRLSAPPPPPMNLGAYRTDDRGVYRIFGLPAGKYKVSVGLPVREGSFSMQTSRSYIPQTFHPDTTDEAQAKIIEVEEGMEVTDVDIKAAEAKKAFEISGRVVESDTGKPVAGVGLSFGSYDQAGRINGTMSGGWRTDTNGEFQILGARPGKHAVFLENRDNKSELYVEPTPIEVIDTDVSGVELHAQRGASLSGTVIIEGTKDPAILARRSQLIILVSRINDSFDNTRSTKVNADGSFRFNGLSPGKFRLSSYAPALKILLARVEQNGAPLKDNDYVIAQNGMPLKEYAVELHSGESATGIRLVFAYADGRVRGQVKILGATLPEGVWLGVGLRRLENTANSAPNPPTARVGADGQFLVTDLIPGDYELRLNAYLTGRRSPQEGVEKIFLRLMNSKQIVSVSNGTEAQITFAVDLSQ